MFTGEASATAEVVGEGGATVLEAFAVGWSLLSVCVVLAGVDVAVGAFAGVVLVGAVVARGSKTSPIMRSLLGLGPR